jgi:hypothetical protein
LPAKLRRGQVGVRFSDLDLDDKTIDGGQIYDGPPD